MATPVDSIEDLPTEEGLFPIRTVCSITGIHPVTLRAWERRYGLIKPRRTPKGHRLYSGEDIELIKRVLRLLDQGVSIGQVGQLLEGQENRAGSVTRASDESGGWIDWRSDLREAIKAVDPSAMERVWEDALSLYSLDTALGRLALPVYQTLRERADTDPAAEGESAFFTRWLRQTLDIRLRHLAPARERHGIIAVPLSESPHDLGLLLFALAATRRGLAIRLVAPGVSRDGIEALGRQSGARALVLYSDGEAPVSETWPAWGRLPVVPVFILGAGFESLPHELKTAGVHELGSDPVRAAVRLHERLIPGSS